MILNKNTMEYVLFTLPGYLHIYLKTLVERPATGYYNRMQNSEPVNRATGYLEINDATSYLY